MIVFAYIIWPLEGSQIFLLKFFRNLFDMTQTSVEEI